MSTNAARTNPKGRSKSVDGRTLYLELRIIIEVNRNDLGDVKGVVTDSAQL